MSSLLNSYTALVCACCSSQFSVSVSEVSSVDKCAVPPANKNCSTGLDGLRRRAFLKASDSSNLDPSLEHDNGPEEIRIGDCGRDSLSECTNQGQEFEGRSVTESEEEALHGGQVKVEVEVDPMNSQLLVDSAVVGVGDEMTPAEHIAEGQPGLNSNINDNESFLGDSDKQQQLPDFSKEKIPAILSLLFEYPWILREEDSMKVFKCSSAEVDIIFCDKCETALFNLYSMFRRFIKLLKNDGKVWNLLRRVGRSDVSNAGPEFKSDSNGRLRSTLGRTRKGLLLRKRKQAVTQKKALRDHGRKGEVAHISVGNKKQRVSRGTPANRQKKLSAVQDVKVLEELEEPAVARVSEGRSGSEMENHEDVDPDLDLIIEDDSDDPNFSPTKKQSSPSRPEQYLEGNKRRRGRPRGGVTKKGREKSPTGKLENSSSDPKSKTQNNKKKRIRIRNLRKEFWIDKAKKDPSRTCEICGKAFLYPRMMVHHKLTVHEGKKPYECEYCGRAFTQNFILKKHTCDYRLAGADKEYLRIAREEQLLRWTCEVCGKRFKERSALSVHQKNHGGETHKCELCAKTFRRPDHLKTHIKIVHSAEKRFCCTVCGQRFKTSSNLRAHENKHVNPDQKHLCSICGKSIKTLSQMSRHQKTHEDVLPFECQLCGKRFKMKDYLGQHLRKGKSCATRVVRNNSIKNFRYVSNDENPASSAAGASEFSPPFIQQAETLQQSTQQHMVEQSSPSLEFPYPLPPVAPDSGLLTL